MAVTRTLTGSYTHTQTAAASTWTINHNLGIYPIVDVWADVGMTSEKIIPLSVTYVDTNTCTVTFSVARTGYATVI